jgi:hypothetical protein
MLALLMVFQRTHAGLPFRANELQFNVPFETGEIVRLPVLAVTVSRAIVSFDAGGFWPRHVPAPRERQTMARPKLFRRRHKGTLHPPTRWWHGTVSGSPHERQAARKSEESSGARKMQLSPDAPRDAIEDTTLRSISQSTPHPALLMQLCTALIAKRAIGGQVVCAPPRRLHENFSARRITRISLCGWVVASPHILTNSRNDVALLFRFALFFTPRHVRLCSGVKCG